MKLQIVKIGNSLGIRIPKIFLNQCGFSDTVIAKVEDCTLILSPDHSPRTGWEDSFKKISECGDDTLLDVDVIESNFDDEGWEW